MPQPELSAGTIRPGPSIREPLNSSRTASAFTLVELLVVLAIIGILVALLLPAIQSAREAARRNQCGNHLKQIGIAIHLYHDAGNRLPMGRDRLDQKGVSWAFRLLPYLEESTIYDSWQIGERVDSPANAAAMRTPVPVYFCPSRRAPVADRDFDNNNSPSLTPAAAAAGDYAANSGTSTRHGMPQYNAAGRINLAEVGPIFTFSRVRLSQVVDGLSQTFVVGDKHLPPRPTNVAPGTEHVRQGDSAFFAGDARHTIFRRSTAHFPDGPHDSYRGHFGGEHTQISQFVFLDGHVQSIQHRIDEEVFELLSAIGDGGVIPDGVISADD